jgi:hypothetical protein
MSTTNSSVDAPDTAPSGWPPRKPLKWIRSIQALSILSSLVSFSQDGNRPELDTIAAWRLCS